MKGVYDVVQAPRTTANKHASSQEMIAVSPNDVHGVPRNDLRLAAGTLTLAAYF